MKEGVPCGENILACLAMLFNGFHSMSFAGSVTVTLYNMIVCGGFNHAVS